MTQWRRCKELILRDIVYIPLYNDVYGVFRTTLYICTRNDNIVLYFVYSKYQKKNGSTDKNKRKNVYNNSLDNRIMCHFMYVCIICFTPTFYVNFVATDFNIRYIHTLHSYKMYKIFYMRMSQENIISNFHILGWTKIYWYFISCTSVSRHNTCLVQHAYVLVNPIRGVQDQESRDLDT